MNRGVAGRAVDQAIRELLLLEASDWAFMLTRGEMATYAEARVRAHAYRAARLSSIALAESVSAEDAAWVDAKVQACQPTAEERRFDEIGWLTDIRSAEALAKEHARPIFLFTHDGHMAVGRC